MTSYQIVGVFRICILAETQAADKSSAAFSDVWREDLSGPSLRPSSQTLRGVYPERSEWAQGDRYDL
jgi:hypothetical protein